MQLSQSSLILNAESLAGNTLSRQSSKPAIRALQILLCSLGYGTELNWDKYRADGDYGGSTTAAVLAFLKKNGLPGDGTTVSPALLAKMKEQQAQAAASNPLARVGDTTQVSNLEKNIRVMDSWISVRFNKHKLGVYNYGEALAASFISKNQEYLLSKGLAPSAVRVVLPVSGNEGNLDAINTWDDSFLTFGMFQWTVGQQGNPGELAGLLKRIKEEDPDAFQEHFLRYGIDTSPETGLTGYLTLQGKKLETTADKEKLRDINVAFRFWKAGLDPRIQSVQVKHAADRIQTFRFATKSYLAAGKFPIGDLITSEYGMCLILDHHVNRPGHLARTTDILGKALTNAGLAATDPKTWTAAEETRLIEAYLPLRAASSMTHGKERADKIKAHADSGQLSRERNSFQIPATRSLAPRGEAVEAELDFKAYEKRRRVPGRKPAVRG